MRKISAILLALTMTACSFASCGKVDDDGGKQGDSVIEENNTVSDGEQSGTDETTDNAQSVTDNTEDEESVRELPTDKTTDNAQSDYDSNADPAVGIWQFNDYTQDVNYLKIHDRENASILITQDLSDMIFFDEEQSLIFPGDTFSAEEYKFDGKTFTLDVNGRNYLTMEKTDGSNDLFGKYMWVGGEMYEAIAQTPISGAADSLYMECSENSTTLFLEWDIKNFSLTDDTITIEGSAFGYDGCIIMSPLTAAPYTIDGNTMTTVNDNGEELKLTKVSEISGYETGITR